MPYTCTCGRFYLLLTAILLLPTALSCSKRKAGPDSFSRGVAALEQGDHDLAITCFTEAIRLDAKNAAAYSYRGYVYDQKGEYDKAIADYTEAIRLNPDDFESYMARGADRGDQGEHDLAIADYTEAIRIDPSNSIAFFNRGNNYLKKGDYDRAIADLTEAIRLNPNDAEAYGLRGPAYGRKGDRAKAEADLAKAKELGYEPPDDQFGHKMTFFHSKEDERSDEKKPRGGVAEMGKPYEVELTFPQDWTPKQTTWFTGSCNVVVARVGEDLYRIDGFDADTGLGQNDVIEAEAKDNGSLLFRRVVKSNWQFYSYLIPGSSDWIHSDYPKLIRKILDHVAGLGGHWEHWQPGFLSFFVPRDVGYDPSDDLNKALKSLPPRQ